MLDDRTLIEFKTGINLVEFATSYGYVLDRRETSGNSAVMRHAGGDKIIVARAAHGHWVYFSVRDDADNGTIIDFIQHRNQGATLGHVRRELAAWSGAVSGCRIRPRTRTLRRAAFYRLLVLWAWALE